MKTIKTILFLSLFSITLTSCTDLDETEEQTETTTISMQTANNLQSTNGDNDTANGSGKD